MNNDKIPTNLGPKSVAEIIDHLTYVSYATQRDAGATHESCINIGLGNEQFKIKYENNKKNP